MTTQLSRDEQNILLTTARNAIQQELNQEKGFIPGLDDYPAILQEKGACFITIKKKGMLRGCVGSIEAIQPLIEDVRSRAVAASFQDPRFPPLEISELEDITIEISRLTAPSRLIYQTPEDLLDQVRPGVDGVILSDQFRRATFLPQVWEQLPDAEIFLDRLCLKMGLDKSIWRTASLKVETYQVEKFQEKD